MTELRDQQRAPVGDWRYWLALGQRGAGKTRAAAEWLTGIAQPEHRAFVLAPTRVHLHTVVVPAILTLPKLQDHQPQVDLIRSVIRMRDGGEIDLFSAQEPEDLRGPAYSYGWLEEVSLLDRRAVRLAMVALRKGPEQLVATDFSIDGKPQPGVASDIAASHGAKVTVMKP